MNRNIGDFTTSVLSAMGITLSVQDVTEMLNLLLLIVSIVNIIIVVGLRVYNLIKEKKYDIVKEEIKNGVEEIDEVINKYEDN